MTIDKTINEKKLQQNTTTRTDNRSNDVNTEITEVTIRTKARKGQNRTKIPKNALVPCFYKHELVWAHLKGFPYWPGVIEDFLPNEKLLIHFFGDYTKGFVGRHHIKNYFEGFTQFSCNFGNVKLHKAVEEAKYFLLGQRKNDTCAVCEILNYKKTYKYFKFVNERNNFEYFVN